VALALPMADAPRYQVALGDTVPEALPGLRLLPLARPEATIAAVRFVQLPQWKEWGILASHLTLSVGYADLLATLGDESYAAATYVRFVEHATVIAAELALLCTPGATITVIPCCNFDGWAWEARFNAALSGIIGA